MEISNAFFWIDYNSRLNKLKEKYWTDGQASYLFKLTNLLDPINSNQRWRSDNQTNNLQFI